MFSQHMPAHLLLTMQRLAKNRTGDTQVRHLRRSLAIACCSSAYLMSAMVLQLVERRNLGPCGQSSPSRPATVWSPELTEIV